MCVHARSLIFDTLWPMNYSPPVLSVHGILQSRILEWLAMSFSRGYSWPRDWTSVFCVSCIEGGLFTTEPLGKLNNKITLKALSLFSIWFYNMLRHEYYLVSYRDAQGKFYDLWPFHRNKKSLLSQLQSPSYLASCLEEFLPYIKYRSDLHNLEFLYYGFFLFLT